MLSVPKIIHLCWFSNEKLPFANRLCINSWRKYLLDYKIKIWTKEMALNINNDFVAEAISAKKWAFAADVVRCYALYTEGGVYLDSDIEVLKSFDDVICNNVVLFNEFHPELFNTENIDCNGVPDDSSTVIPGLGIQAAFMISMPGQPIIKSFLEYYDNIHFKKMDAGYNQNLISPAVFAQKALSYGYIYKDIQQDLGSITILPSSYVCPNRYTKASNNSIAIHMCRNSWQPRTAKEKIINMIADVWFYFRKICCW